MTDSKQLSPFLAIPLALLAACTGEAPQMSSTGFVNGEGNHPPIIRSAKLTPEPLVLSGPLSVQVDADDPDRNPLTFRYKWFVNDAQVAGQVEHQLPPALLKRGNRLSVEVTPFDGHVEGAPYKTAPLMVENTPPVVVQVTFEPAQVALGEKLHVRAEVSDADHDNVHLFYRWWKNQSLVKEGEENEIDTSGFALKDVVRVEVIPQDDASKGQGLSSSLIVGNSPPKIVSSPAMTMNQSSYQYTIQAKDPDGDPIAFALETAPPGMSVDKSTGQITWQIPSDLKGTHRVRVVAEDGQGGSAFQEFELTLAPPAASPSS